MAEKNVQERGVGQSNQIGMIGGLPAYDPSTGRAYSAGPPAGMQFGAGGGGGEAAATSPYAGAFKGLTIPAASSTAASTGGTAAATGAGSGMWGSLISQGVGVGGSILGGLLSGERGLNKTRTEILKKLLSEYTNMAPGRAGVQSSYLGRLPGYMQANFPQAAPPRSGIWGILTGQNNSSVGKVPYYPGANTPGAFPTYPGFDPNAMPKGM